MGSFSSTDAEFRDRIHQQEVVAELGQQALETDDLDQVMHHAATAIADTLDNEYCKVLELMPGGDEVFLRQGVGWQEGLVGNTMVPTDRDSQAGYTMLTEKPVIVEDLRTEERFSGPELLTSHDVVSGISVIIGSIEDPWGVLGTHTTERCEFTEYDAAFVQSVANILASTIENEAAHTELQEIHDRITSGILALNESWELTHINRQAEEILGYDADELLGANMWEAFPEAIGTEFEERYHEAMASQESVSFEAYYPPNNAWFEEHVYPSETGLSVYFRDVTQRKGRERELERALDLLERTERVANVGGWEIDVETQDVFWTDHIFELLEVDSTEEPPLDEALAMYHEDDQTIVEDAVGNALDSGEPFDVEVRIRTNSGEIRWLRLQGVPETVGDDIVSLRGAAQDVTDRKQREQRLEELIDRLEASNNRLEQFAHAASHDLQEPLRMVSSYLQLIEQRYSDALDEDGEEFIEFAVDGADRMREMIDGLLKYSRIEAQGDPLEPVDLDAVFEDILDDLQVRIDESDADITAEELPRVTGDAGQLRQVFQNLLENAIEYSGDVPPRVHVSADRDGPKWIISVSDEGTGVDPDYHERIFEVFQRLHDSTGHSGTGIGLALCERIIERHGGDIWVESESIDGSTFYFTLPDASQAEE